LLFSEGGLKLQEEAAGNPLQLNVTVPAAAVASTPSGNRAVCPAVTVTGAPPEKMVRKALISVLMLAVLFLGSVSPVSETVATIELTDRGAFRATLNVIVRSGYLRLDPSGSVRVHVRLANVQLHPVPLRAVAVNPGTRVIVSVTAPLVAELPKFKIEVLKVIPVAPWVTKSWRGELVTPRSTPGFTMVVTSPTKSLAVSVSPPPETVAVFVSKVEVLVETFTVRLIGG